MGRAARLDLAVLLAGVLFLQSPSRAGMEPLPDTRLGIRTAPLLLLSRGDVQADLRLSRTQVDDALEAIRTLQAKAAELRGMKGEKAVEARRAIDADQQRWLESRLSESQRKRIVQIDLQWEGPAALVSRPALSEMLGLTSEQRASLRIAVDESHKRRAGGGAVSEVEPKLAQEALKILTEPQRTRWKEILGRPYQPRLDRTNAGGP